MCSHSNVQGMGAVVASCKQHADQKIIRLVGTAQLSTKQPHLCSQQVAQNYYENRTEK